MRRPDCSSEEAGKLPGARPQPQEQLAALPRLTEKTRTTARRTRGYSRTAAGTSAPTRTGRSTPSAPLWENAPGYPGPAPPRSPGPNPARPVPVHAAGPPNPASLSSGEGWKGRVQTHCSTPSRESQPRRCRRAAGSGARPPAPHWPPPCRDYGKREGRREGQREGGVAPPRPARNGGGGPDPGGWGGCLPPALSLLSTARRVRSARRGGLLRAGGPGNAGLLLPVPRGERLGARPVSCAVSRCGTVAVSLQLVLSACCFLSCPTPNPYCRLVSG